MPTFILAGLQRSLVRQVKKELLTHKGRFGNWTPLLIPSYRNNQAGFNRELVQEVCNRASEHEGAPIFALSDDRDRHVAENALKPYFRFRWLETRTVRQVGIGNSEPLVAHLERAIVEETLWEQTIKPIHWSSPLILPTVFHPIRELADIWRLANSYNDVENTKAAQRMIARFKREHRRKIDDYSGSPWVDVGHWIWDDAGARHGEAEFPTNWKYSYRLPHGFHFDVQSEGNLNTVFSDVNGARHTLKKGYLNVTAHGLVRG